MKVLTHNGTNTITTERLILRRFEYTDNDAMLKYWVADERIQSLYSEPVYSTKEEVKELLDKYIGSYEKNDYYRWAIIEKKSGECIGTLYSEKTKPKPIFDLGFVWCTIRNSNP